MGAILRSRVQLEKTHTQHSKLVNKSIEQWHQCNLMRLHDFIVWTMNSFLKRNQFNKKSCYNFMTESETVNLRNEKIHTSQSSRKCIAKQCNCEWRLRVNAHWRLWVFVCACVYWLKKLHNLDTTAAVPRVWSARASIGFVWFCKYADDDEYDHTHTQTHQRRIVSQRKSQ